MIRKARYQISWFYPCFFLLILGSLSIDPGLKPAWAQQAFTTQRAVIHYDNPADLQEMERRLRFTQVDKLIFYTQDPAQAALSPRLAAKIEGLLTKVSQILNMWPKNPHPLRIILLKDEYQIRQRYLVFNPLQKRSFFGYDPVYAFYESRSHTIFLSLADLHEGILAHEMAHFVLCESFPVPPPTALQEEWAQYVESRLN